MLSTVREVWHPTSPQAISLAGRGDKFGQRDQPLYFLPREGTPLMRTAWWLSLIFAAFLAGALLSAQGKASAFITVKDVNGDCWSIEPKSMMLRLTWGRYVEFKNVVSLCPSCHAKEHRL